MGDSLKKVKSGDPLDIPAKTYNTLIDTANDFLRRQQNRGSTGQPAFRQTGIVLIKNSSGADRGRFDVLGIDGVVITPTDNADEFKARVILDGITPSTASHTGRFAVLLEPIASGALGRAFIDGICPVQINVTDADHEYADVNDGQAGSLASAETGSAIILWREAGMGLKWAVIRIGLLGGGAGSLPDGDSVNDTLVWDNINSIWMLINGPADGPVNDYKVMQRKTDNTLGWDWVRAHA